MSASQVPTSVTIIDSLCGFQAISLTSFDTSAECAIAAGSKLEIAGAFFNFTTDTTPSASSWSSVSTATTAYIQCVPSGTVGSQILTVTYTSTAPTWRDDLQGWYASAGSTTRVVASVYKGESTSYWYKKILYPRQEATGNDLYDNKGNIVNAHGSTTFTSSGTFSAPVTTVYITGTGGGGAGSAGITVTTGGIGGAAGAYVYRKSYTVIPNETITVTIGAAGGNVTVSSTSIALTLTGGSSIGALGGAGGVCVVLGSGAGGRGENFGGYGGDSGYGGGGGGGGGGSHGVFNSLDSLATPGAASQGAGGRAGYGGGGGGGGGSPVVAGGAGGAGKNAAEVAAVVAAPQAVPVVPVVQV